MSEPWNTAPGTTEKDISPKEDPCDHKYVNDVSALVPVQGGFQCMICDEIVIGEEE